MFIATTPNVWSTKLSDNTQRIIDNLTTRGSDCKILTLVALLSHAHHSKYHEISVCKIKKRNLLRKLYFS